MAAAPAALTLFSGSALAATSSRCQTNALAANPPNQPSVIASNDNLWVRVQAYTLNKGGNREAIFIKVSDLTGVATGFNEALATNLIGGQYLFIAAPGTASAYKNTTPGTVLTTAPTDSQGQTTYTPQQNGGFYAVRFASDGTVLGVFGDGTNTGTAISQSCLNSFRGI